MRAVSRAIRTAALSLAQLSNGRAETSTRASVEAHAHAGLDVDREVEVVGHLGAVAMHVLRSTRHADARIARFEP